MPALLRVCAVCVSIGHTQVSMVSMSRQVGLTLCYLHHHHHQVAAAVHQASATFHTTLRWCTNSILFKHLAQLVTCATESVSVCLALLCQWPPPHDGGQAGRQASRLRLRYSSSQPPMLLVMMEDDAMEQQNMNRPDMSECISSSTLIFDAGHMRSSQ